MIDDAHLTHGLAGDELPPDWPPLTERDVAAVLARVPDVGGARAIHWRSPRPLSAAALVDTAHGRVFVKRHHASVRTAATLAEEHRFAAHLRERGVPVPALFVDDEGHTAMAAGEWTYEVQTPARGHDIYREAFSWSPVDGLSHARAAGAMLAHLHVAADSYVAPQRDTHILVARADILAAVDPIDALMAQGAHRPALMHYLEDRDWKRELRDAIAPFHANVQPALARQPRRWTHGDWHVSNLCWSHDGEDAEVSDVLDFGLSALTFPLFDLATAIERNAIAWLDIAKGDIGREDLALALVEGYHAVHPLTDDDLRVLAGLMPLVHIDFAVSEVEYFEGITRHRDHADVAWCTFALGHAAWFATPPGQRLMRTLCHARARFVVQ